MSRNSGRNNSGPTRRVVLLAAGGAAASGGLVSSARAEAKVSQVAAKYRNHPNGQQRCAICLQFQPPATCAIVAGTISPTGWCQFFAARENAH
ncbi:MAG: iron oxidase [Betaproteobacteria bacterium]|nr:iron oxidase [Betaproteobacteria bacterium]